MTEFAKASFRANEPPAPARPNSATTPSSLPPIQWTGNQSSLRRLPLQRPRYSSSSLPNSTPSRLGSPSLPEHVTRALYSSPGERLPHAIQTTFGKKFRKDLSHVTLHRDAEASSAVRSIGANAFAHGSKLFFRDGAFQPDTRDGQALLAHELTHVVQQTSSPASQFSDAENSEQFAQRASLQHLAGSSSLHAGPSAPLAIAADTGVTIPDDLRASHHVGKGRVKKEKKPVPPSVRFGVTFEEAVAVISAISAVLPHVEKVSNGVYIQLPGFDTGTEGEPKGLPKNIPARYVALVRDWRFIAHPLIQEPNGLQLSLSGSMREQHLSRAMAETQPLIDELMAEGDESTHDILTDIFYAPYERLREDITEQVVQDSVEKAKHEEGRGFDELSEEEQDKTIIDKALESAEIAIKVVNQYAGNAIHDAVHHAKDYVKMRELDDLFRKLAEEKGEFIDSTVLRAAAHMPLAAALVQIEGALHGVSAILAISDPQKRREMFRARSDLFGKTAEVAEVSKLVLQFTAGATALIGVGAYAVAKLLGKEAIAAKVVAKGVPVLEKLDLAISGVMLVHGALTLLDSDATSEEKEDAVLEVGLGAATVTGRLATTATLGRFLAGFEAAPASLSLIISFYTFRYLGNLAVGMTVGIVQGSLNVCYAYMRSEAMYINDQALGLTIALQTAELEPDAGRKSLLVQTADTFRIRLRDSLQNDIPEAVKESYVDKYPGSHEPLRRRFQPLAKRKSNTDILLLGLAADYLQIVAESFAHPQEILNEDVTDVWEKHG